MQPLLEDGSSPLHFACMHGTLEVVAALLMSGAQLDLADKKGRTPRDLAPDHLRPTIERLARRATEKRALVARAAGLDPDPGLALGALGVRAVGASIAPAAAGGLAPVSIAPAAAGGGGRGAVVPPVSLTKHAGGPDVEGSARREGPLPAEGEGGGNITVGCSGGCSGPLPAEGEGGGSSSTEPMPTVQEAGGCSRGCSGGCRGPDCKSSPGETRGFCQERVPAVAAVAAKGRGRCRLRVAVAAEGRGR